MCRRRRRFPLYSRHPPDTLGAPTRFRAVAVVEAQSIKRGAVAKEMARRRQRCTLNGNSITWMLVAGGLVERRRVVESAEVSGRRGAGWLEVDVHPLVGGFLEFRSRRWEEERQDNWLHRYSLTNLSWGGHQAVGGTWAEPGYCTYIHVSRVVAVGR
jgi:hypothetical protein